MNENIATLKYFLADSYDLFLRRNKLTDKMIEDMDEDGFDALFECMEEFIADSY